MKVLPLGNLYLKSLDEYSDISRIYSPKSILIYTSQPPKTKNIYEYMCINGIAVLNGETVTI